jgi:uncharacterized protein YeaO (DUF488 family)
VKAFLQIGVFQYLNGGLLSEILLREPGLDQAITNGQIALSSRRPINPRTDPLTSSIMEAAKNLFTIGYEGLTLDAFIQRLQSNSVRTLVDVRELPLSRKKGFSKRALAETLATHGITYMHMPTLGCPKPIRDRYRADGNWSRYTHAFMKHLADQQPAVQELADISHALTAALMCYEADFNRCHRTYVARAAVATSDLGVMHITAETTIPESGRRAVA